MNKNCIKADVDNKQYDLKLCSYSSPFANHLLSITSDNFLYSLPIESLEINYPYIANVLSIFFDDIQTKYLGSPKIDKVSQELCPPDRNVTFSYDKKKCQDLITTAPKPVGDDILFKYIMY